MKRIGRVDRLALMVWGSLATTPPLLALSLIVEGPAAPAALAHPDWAAIGSVAFQAYPTTLLAFGLWNRLLTRYPAATVTPFALLVPVAGILSTHTVLGEPLGTNILVGGSLILAGIAVSLRGGRPRAGMATETSPAWTRGASHSASTGRPGYRSQRRYTLS